MVMIGKFVHTIYLFVLFIDNISADVLHTVMGQFLNRLPVRPLSEP